MLYLTQGVIHQLPLGMFFKEVIAMRKLLFMGLAFLLALLLCACTIKGASSTQTSTQDLTSSSVSKPTTPEHSELYLPQYSTDKIWDYFEEIVLDMEYNEGEGDVTLVQKWNAPINYRIYGNPTDKDLEVLSDLFAQLNKVKGFPGIYPARDGEFDNLAISFLDKKTFNEEFSTFLNNEDAYGATQFWYYLENNEIHTARIGYRTDIDQNTRVSILLEEVVNMLGISDTVLREDSIVYQYSNDNMALSDVDWVILKLLYSSDIKSGMDAESCKAVIQKLYY